MDTITYWFCVLMSILGQAAHLFLVKIPSIKSRCRSLNKTFYFREWWNADWNVILGTQAIIALFIVGLDEVLHWKPEVLKYVKWFFAGIGAFGSTIAMAKASQFEKGITGLIDVKSNISDAAVGNAQNKTEAIVKAAEQGFDATQPEQTKP